MSKISLLFSSGVDSMLLAYMAWKTEDLCSIHLFDNGQAPYQKQLEIANWVGDKTGCKVVTHKFPFREWDISGELDKHPGFNIGGKPDAPFSRSDLNKVEVELQTNPGIAWINGRNPLMLFTAAVQASYFGANRLWSGFHVNDDEIIYNTNPFGERSDDTTRHIFDYVNELIRLSFPSKTPFMCSAPLLNFNKRQIMKMAKNIGAQEWIDISYSCEYYPKCGICSQCLDREWAEKE